MTDRGCQNGQSTKTPTSPPPSAWVASQLHGAPTDKTVVDLACGSGRHTRLALGAGLNVNAVDRDTSKLDELSDHPALTISTFDLELGKPYPIDKQSVGCTIVTNYLFRPILSDIVESISDDGILIYETFAVGNERFGKPSNPDFLLQPGELIKATKDRLTTIRYEHATLSNPSRIVARIAAVGPAHKWLNDPPAI
ncbi:MAG: SAM-dependent methyltransferase [Pseudomonadota bacterium]